MAATEARPWQNTIEYNWLGTGDVLDGRMVLEVVTIDRRFCPRRLGRDDFKKRDAAAMSGNMLPKGDPSGIA